MCYGLGSIVGIVTCSGLDDLGIESLWGVRLPALVQTVPGAHLASCMMGTISLPDSKVAGVWH
jgi:hypothetical protein